MGLVAPLHVESSQTRDPTHVLCIGRQILNHWTTRGVQSHTSSLSTIPPPTALRKKKSSCTQVVHAWLQTLVDFQLCLPRIKATVVIHHPTVGELSLDVALTLQHWTLFWCPVFIILYQCSLQLPLKVHLLDSIYGQSHYSTFFRKIRLHSVSHSLFWPIIAHQFFVCLFVFGCAGSLLLRWGFL